MAHFIRSPLVTFEHPALVAPITLEHEPDGLPSAGDDAADGTNLRLWPSSLVLSQWLCAHPEFVVGKRVVELGAGSGAVGLVCAALGASSVTLTDVPDALPLIERNAQRNPPRAGTTVRVLPCLWGDAGHIDELLRGETHGECAGYDVVLCCEVVYQQPSDVLTKLAHTQRALAHSQHAPASSRSPCSKVLLAYEFRNALIEDLAYFDAATDLFGESSSYSLCGDGASGYMEGGADDGDNDRFLYVYDVASQRDEGVPAPLPAPGEPVATTSSGGGGGADESCGDSSSTQPAAGGAVAPDVTDRTGALAWARQCLRPDGTMRCWVEMDELFPSAPPTVLHLWTVSLLLLRYLETDRDCGRWRGQRVLELGSGAGHLAVGLARLGAHVDATESAEINGGECYADMQRYTRMLLAERDGGGEEVPEVAGVPRWSAGGGSDGSIGFRKLHWGLDDASDPASWLGYDTLVLADLLYDEDAHEALLSTLCRILPCGAVAYSAFVDRPYSLQFMAMLDDDGSFKVEQIDMSERLALREDEVVFAHRITRRPHTQTAPQPASQTAVATSA